MGDNENFGLNKNFTEKNHTEPRNRRSTMDCQENEDGEIPPKKIDNEKSSAENLSFKSACSFENFQEASCSESTDSNSSNNFQNCSTSSNIKSDVLQNQSDNSSTTNVENMEKSVEAVIQGEDQAVNNVDHDVIESTDYQILLDSLMRQNTDGGDVAEMDSTHSSTSQSDVSETHEEGEENFTCKPNWRVIESVKDREYGFKSKITTDWFRYRAAGSVHFVQRLELMRKLDFHNGCVNCLHFNYDGTRLLSGSDDMQISMWDWAVYTKKPQLSFHSGHKANVFQAKFMPFSGDRHVVTCARDGQVRLAELSARNVCMYTRKLAQHKGSAHKLSILKDSPHVFRTCGEDAIVYEIDLRDPTPNKLITVKGSKNRPVPLYSIDTDPCVSFYFAVCGQDNFCRIYDRRCAGTGDAGKTPLKKLSPSHLIEPSDAKYFDRSSITCGVYNYNGSEILASYNDDDIYLFDTKCNTEDGDAAILHRYTGHRNNATVKGVNFYGPSSEFIVSGSDCSNIYFWSKETEQIIKFMSGDENGVVNVLEPHPCTAMLATSGLDNDVKLWVPSDENPKFEHRTLEKLVRSNLKQRKTDRSHSPADLFDSRMMWMVLSRTLRQRRRAQRDGENYTAAAAGDDQNMDEDSADNNTSDTNDDDDDVTEMTDDNDDGPVLQCRPS